MLMLNYRRRGTRGSLIAALLLTATVTATGQDAEPDLPPAIATAFDSRDTDADGLLSSEEFVAGKERGPQVMQRDFAVLDLDGDGAMSKAEFLNVPYIVPLPRRGNLPDPISGWFEDRVADVRSSWNTWDADGSGALSRAEFEASGILQVAPGLQTTVFADWDRDGDGEVSDEDSRSLLEIAYGVRREDGELLRLPTGRVAAWAHFQNIDRDDDDRLNREEFVKGNGDNEAAETMFERADADADGSVSFAEWRAHPRGALDSMAHFMNLDTDRDGQISFTELQAAAPHTRLLNEQTFPAFDTDRDGSLSYLEYRTLPQFNLVVAWHFRRRDSDADGRLSFSEFKWGDGPAMTALRGEFFSRVDVNGDGTLGPDEWRFNSGHPEVKFRNTDADWSGSLSAEEFATATPPRLGRDVVERDFRVFDLDGDGSLAREEFMVIPYLVPWEYRGELPDPVVALVDERMNGLTEQWGSWDGDGSGGLSRTEFTTAAMNRSIPGLELTEFNGWDQGGDGEVSPEDARRMLEVAYGVRRPEGDLIRTPSGDVFDWRVFKALDRDADGMIEEEDFMSSYYARRAEDPEARFREIDTDGDGRAGFQEWSAQRGFWSSSVGRFLQLDLNLDGVVDREELLDPGQPEGQKPMLEHLLPAFDVDGDAVLSLSEYQLTPVANVFAGWTSASDTDHDGQLSAFEFRFVDDGTSLAALSHVFFTRLDVDEDGFLSLNEWPFRINIARAPRHIVFQQRDTDGDGRLSFEEVLGGRGRPKPGEPVDMRQEARLLRVEEAFNRADADGDELLNLEEFSTDDGLEAIAPGSAAIDRQDVRNRGLTEVLQTEGADVRTALIIGFNVLVVAFVAVYLFRKTKPAS